MRLSNTSPHWGEEGYRKLGRLAKFYGNTDKKSDVDKQIDNQKNYTENNDTKSSNDNDKN